MTKMFYSFDDGNLYHLHRHCDLETLMHEQFTQNGVLIYAEDDKFDLVEYNGGCEVDTRFLIHMDDGTVVMDDGTVVLRKCREVEDKDVDDFFSFIDNMIAGE